MGKMLMRFASKGQTLLNLSEKLASAFVPKLMVFSVDDWRQNQKGLQQELKKAFAPRSYSEIKLSFEATSNHLTPGLFCHVWSRSL